MYDLSNGEANQNAQIKILMSYISRDKINVYTLKYLVIVVNKNLLNWYNRYWHSYNELSFKLVEIEIFSILVPRTIILIFQLRYILPNFQEK